MDEYVRGWSYINYVMHFSGELWEFTLIFIKTVKDKFKLIYTLLKLVRFSVVFLSSNECVIFIDVCFNIGCLLVKFLMLKMCKHLFTKIGFKFVLSLFCVT